MQNLTCTVKGNSVTLVILDITKMTHETDKSYVLASSHGFKPVSDMVAADQDAGKAGNVQVSLNVIRSKGAQPAAPTSELATIPE